VDLPIKMVIFHSYVSLPEGSSNNKNRNTNTGCSNYSSAVTIL
jgi:hypothetical protein